MLSADNSTMLGLANIIVSRLFLAFSTQEGRCWTTGLCSIYSCHIVFWAAYAVVTIAFVGYVRFVDCDFSESNRVTVQCGMSSTQQKEVTPHILASCQLSRTKNSNFLLVPQSINLCWCACRLTSACGIWGTNLMFVFLVYSQ